MAFSDFRYPELLQTFNLTETVIDDLFAGVAPVSPSANAVSAVELGSQLAPLIDTEKARREYLTAPILGEFWSRYHGRISLASGNELNADPDCGLTGICDFLIGRMPQVPRARAPLAIIFEAKRDNIMDGYGQCIAGMVGVQRFNRREGMPVDPVYGCVTTGVNWKFMRLEGSAVTIDSTEQHFSQLDKLLGIFTFMIGPVAEAAAA